MRTHSTRRTRLLAGAGILAVVMVAVLTAFALGGIPSGGKLMGEATISGNRILLHSGRWGLATGVLTVRNDTSQDIYLFSLTEDGKPHGGDRLRPGESKSYDYKGSWIVEADPVLPTVTGDRDTGGGAGEGGLRMGPYGGTVVVKGYTIEPGANLYDADLRYSNLIGVDLSGAHMGLARLEGALLYRAQLQGAYLKDAYLNGDTCLAKANLTNARLLRVEADGADFSGANMQGANLMGIQARWANFTGANLRGADLEGANLLGANLTNADLTGAHFYATRMPDGNVRY